MLIRRCQEADMPHLLEIWLQATLHAFDALPAAFWWPRQEAMRARLEAGAEIWVIEQASQVIAFMALKDNEVLALYVRPDRQGEGMGSALLSLARRRRHSLYLWVGVQNTEAVRYYQERGFRIRREQKGRPQGLDEYLMELGQA